MQDSSFHDYVVYDLLGTLPDISSKRMFGGWGIYQGETFFAIISDGELYFKVDDTNRVAYECMDESHIFTYKKQGKQQEISYWSVPAEVMEDQERLHELVAQSVAVSRRQGGGE